MLGLGAKQSRDPFEMAGRSSAAIAAEAVVCYKCGGTTRVSARAMSAACEHCRGTLDIGDIRIKATHWGGVLCTCGCLTIARKARVAVKMAVASLRADVMGEFKGVVVCGGPVTIGSRAVFEGAVWAPSLTVEPGAEIRGGPFVVGCRPLGRVEISATTGRLPPPPTLEPSAAPLARIA